MIADRIINLLLFFCTAGICISYFRKDGHWNVSYGLKAFRFFTTLSNVLCGIAGLCVAATLHGADLPYGVWLLKYFGTSTVTVTFLTVMLFLGPAAGYKKMLSRDSFYMHLLGPLLALISFCFLERQYELTLSLSLLSLVPVFLYGAVYLYQVVIAENWEDFYGYNKNGKWPLSFAAMMVAGVLIGLLLRFLSRL